MPKFIVEPTIHMEKVETYRVGTEAAPLTDKDVYKAVKLSGESGYDLCAAGDPIEGILTSTNIGTQDGFKIGGVVSTGYFSATVVGGALAIGDYVVAAAQPAKGTVLPANTPVQKAVDPEGPFKARVVSLGPVGSGAVGTRITVKLLGQ